LNSSTTPSVAAPLAIVNVDACGENVDEEVHGRSIGPTGDDPVNKTVQARAIGDEARAIGDDALAMERDCEISRPSGFASVDLVDHPGRCLSPQR
jgi:hypothetical protein